MDCIALAALVIVVKMGDIGAYTVGRLFGRHKMAPVLSPGKTWEGARRRTGVCLDRRLGGVSFAARQDGTYAGPSLVELAAVRHCWWALTGILGDLAESLFKRDVGRKDSSTWLPGFGGILDVLDSILFAAPVAYVCWYAGSL